MKIISWNLKNLGQNKLNNAFTPTFRAYGLGNNVSEYILSVVLGTNRWTNIASANAADVFVIIELKTGGSSKNQPANGTAIPTLNALVGAMNVVMNANPNVHYSYAAPLIVGRHESVGVIYNDRVFNNPQSLVLRDNNNLYINPRSPIRVTLTYVANPMNVLHVIGIHAPPVKGGANIRYRPPIQFLRRAATVPQLAVNGSLVMGDFNCAPNSTYNAGMGNVGWNFVGYQTLIPNGTLSSVRNKVVNTLPQPQNYLNEPYDNILANNMPMGAVESVMDTIGNARNFSVNPPAPLYPGNLVTTLNNYNRVSDHLPLRLEA